MIPKRKSRVKNGLMLDLPLGTRSNQCLKGGGMRGLGRENRRDLAQRMLLAALSLVRGRGLENPTDRRPLIESETSLRSWSKSAMLHGMSCVLTLGPRENDMSWWKKSYLITTLRKTSRKEEEIVGLQRGR
jgi:hypothetical protein